MRFFRQKMSEKSIQSHVHPLPSASIDNRNLSTNVVKNEQILRAILKDCSEVVFRRIPINGDSILLMVYVNVLVDTAVLEEVVLQPLLFQGTPRAPGGFRNIRQVLANQLVAIAETKTVSTVGDVVQGILKGNVAFMADGLNEALMATVQESEMRSIGKPENEASVRGPRDSFTESLRVNFMLLRRRIASPKLKTETFTIGEITQTDVIVAYVDGLVVPSVLEAVRTKLSEICMKGVIDSGYIEERIQDSPLSPFPQVQNTERPDVVAASLLEGKVAILTNGTPFALIVPMTFWAGLQAADDHYERFEFTILRRMVRYVMTLISLALPAAYVSLTTYNPEMLPAQLMQSIASAREISPFPTVIETTLMEFIFEGLQEAGLRLPAQMGPVVSIVGALVIGEAAVRANIVSAPIVIVVALTGIATYIMPRYSFGIPFRILRFFLLFLAGMFGVYGLSIGMVIIMIHLITLNSFNTPYFTPVAPLVVYHLRDVVARTPRWKNNWMPRRH